MPMLCGGTAAAVSPARREELDGRDGHGPSCPGGMVAGWIWTLARPVFLLFLLPSLLLGYCPYISGTTISLLVRLTLLFFSFGGD